MSKCLCIIPKRRKLSWRGTTTHYRPVHLSWLTPAEEMETLACCSATITDLGMSRVPSCPPFSRSRGPSRSGGLFPCLQKKNHLKRRIGVSWNISLYLSSGRTGNRKWAVNARLSCLKAISIFHSGLIFKIWYHSQNCSKIIQLLLPPFPCFAFNPSPKSDGMQDCNIKNHQQNIKT